MVITNGSYDRWTVIATFARRSSFSARMEDNFRKSPSPSSYPFFVAFVGSFDSTNLYKFFFLFYFIKNNTCVNHLRLHYLDTDYGYSRIITRFPIRGLTKGTAYRLNSHVEWVTRCNRVLTIHEWYTAGQGFENYAQLLRSRHSKSWTRYRSVVGWRPFEAPSRLHRR